MNQNPGAGGIIPRSSDRNESQWNENAESKGVEHESRGERKGQTLKWGTMLGPGAHSRDVDVYPKSKGKLLKDFKQSSDRAGAFGNVPCDSTGRTAWSSQRGFGTTV